PKRLSSGERRERRWNVAGTLSPEGVPCNSANGACPPTRLRPPGWWPAEGSARRTGGAARTTQPTLPGHELADDEIRLPVVEHPCPQTKLPSGLLDSQVDIRIGIVDGCLDAVHGAEVGDGDGPRVNAC